jgi:hypothetical protein
VESCGSVHHIVRKLSLKQCHVGAGAPWNAIDKEGRCAGEYAMDAGQQEAIDVLLEAGLLS